MDLGGRAPGTCTVVNISDCVERTRPDVLIGLFPCDHTGQLCVIQVHSVRTGQWAHFVLTLDRSHYESMSHEWTGTNLNLYGLCPLCGECVTVPG